MYLFIAITTLTALLSFIHKIITPFQKFLKRPSAKEKKIIESIQNLRKELSKIPMRDDYVNYVKTERKIVALERDLNGIKFENNTRNMIIDHALGYGIQCLISTILLIISIIYRTTPIVIFDESKFNFTPLTRLISFPCGIDGAISTPIWIFLSSFTFRAFASSIR